MANENNAPPPSGKDLGKPLGQTELDILNADDTPDDVGSPDSDESDETTKRPSDLLEELDEDSESSDESDEEDSDSKGDESDEESDESESDDSDEPSDVSLYQAVKKASPELFKRFPELKNVIFREQRYADTFPTVEEARVAKDRNESFSQLENDIMEGKPSSLFQAVESTDKEAFSRLAHSILPSILEQNKDLYSEVIAIPIKRAIQQAYIHGKKSKNENIMNSALHLDDFFFEGDGIGNDPRLSSAPKKTKEKTPEIERLERERDEHAERIRGEFNESVIESLRFKLTKEIKEAISTLDFDEYKRKNVVKDIESEVNRILSADTRYQASAKSLYNQASGAKFAGEWKARIISAYLARAKAALPLAKKKVIEEATGRKQKPEERKRLVPTNLSTPNNRTLNVKDIDRSKTTDRDILDDKITFKSSSAVKR